MLIVFEKCWKNDSFLVTFLDGDFCERGDSPYYLGICAIDTLESDESCLLPSEMIPIGSSSCLG
jgi:hypothetical protein